MENFIKKMMELGAGIELSCSNKEKEIFMSEAKKEYKKHFKDITKKAGSSLIPNTDKVLVLDIETNTVNELVSINIAEDHVVMYAKEAGYTGNLMSKVKLYTEPKS